jgi:hypothetical protein
MTISKLWTCLALAAAVLIGGASRATAQLPIPSVAIVGGVSHYSLDASGSAPFGALRVDVPLFVILAEGSLGAFRATENGNGHTYVIPEAQLQWQLLPVLVRPYIGVGAGWFKSVSGPSTQASDLTLSASAGVRVGVPLTGLGGRAEVRVREIGGDFHRHTTELTLGLSW